MYALSLGSRNVFVTRVYRGDGLGVLGLQLGW